MNPIGLSQNQVTDLPSLTRTRYENIFKVFKLLKDKDNSYYFYNINNKIMIPDDLDDSIFNVITPNVNTAWTTLSFRLYGTIDLWWLIFIINKPKDIFLAKSGESYRYIKPGFIDNVLTNIEQQINA
jgi:hypothetical protein